MLGYRNSTCITLTKGTYTVSAMVTCFCNSALATESGAELSLAIRDLSGMLANAIIAALVVAVIVYCLIEIIKLPLRLCFNFIVVQSWRRKLYFFRDYGRRFRSDDSFDHGNVINPRGAQLFLSTDLLIKRLENRARAAMEAAQNSVELYFFATGVDKVDIDLVRKALCDDGPPDERLGAAQTNVAAAIERNLDELQITMTFWWPPVVQAMAIIVSLSIVFVFSYTVGGLGGVPLLLLLIAVASACLASVFRDLVGILHRLGSR